MTSMIGKICIAVLCFAAANTLVDANDLPSCMDEDGNRVDWFIAYKFPELSDQAKPFDSGYAYAYITSNSVNHKNRTFWSDVEDSVVQYAATARTKMMKTFGRYNITDRRRKNSSVESQNVTASNNENNPRLKAPDQLYWTISGKLITDPKSAILRTLAVAYNDRRSKINSIYYNDGPPITEHADGEQNPSRRKAHAKGVLIIDDITGKSVWMTHSTPQFPPARSMQLEFNENSRKYGQTFMCVNFDSRSAGNQIVNHLVNMDPLVYDSQISDRLFALIPSLHNLQLENQRAHRRRDRGRATTKLSQKIETTAGQDLYIYSKSADFGDDLYAGWIDAELKSTLFVETWRNGAGHPLNSSCPRNNYRVNNVQDLNVRKDNSKVTWSYHQDHSKWAISEDKSLGYVCVSDINRMQSQFKRGGGAVCMKCKNCWSVFSNTILDLEPCPIKRHD